ncbi:MAG: Sec-independent protein translocase protein TatB [Caulobacteraceae bacterium]
MLPEAGATELIFLAAVALIVVGPKDLPVLLRKVGQFTAKMRGLAAEFRSSFDELARQSELDELRREVDALRRGDFTQPLRQDMSDIDSHFESLHREIGAPPPTGFGPREGEIVPGPDAPSAALPSPPAESAESGRHTSEAPAAEIPASEAKAELSPEHAPHTSDAPAPAPTHAQEHAG